MIYKTKTIDRTLQSVPFERAFQIYTDAYTNSIQNQEHYYEQQQEQRVAYIEDQLAKTNNTEAPSEVPVEVDTQPASIKAAHTAGVKAIHEEFLVSGLIAENMQAHYMPQIMQLLARRWNPDLVQPDQEGRGVDEVNGSDARKELFLDFKSDWDKGLWLFLMLDSRSSWLKSQYKGEGRTYCALVPLILYAIKNAHNVKYSQWTDIEAVVNPKLATAMKYEFDPNGEWANSTDEQKIVWRNQALTFKTGVKVGQIRPAESTYKLFGTTGTPLLGVPELAQVMATQIWCAHPKNRTRHMILSPSCWEYMPPPLQTSGLFMTDKVVEPSPDLPW